MNENCIQNQQPKPTNSCTICIMAVMRPFLAVNGLASCWSASGKARGFLCSLGHGRGPADGGKRAGKAELVWRRQNQSDFPACLPITNMIGIEGIDSSASACWG